MKLITILLFAALPLSSFAADHVIFSCTNKQGKKVVVQSVGNKIQYSFGKPDKPELVFSNTRKQVISQTKANPTPNVRTQWIVLKNGQYSYWPRTHFTQLDEKGDVESEAGVWVFKGDKNISEIICDERKHDSYVHLDEDLFN